MKHLDQNNPVTIPCPESKPVFDKRKILKWGDLEIGKVYPVDPHITETKIEAQYYPMIFTSTEENRGFAIMVGEEIRHFAPSSIGGAYIDKEGIILPISILRILNPGDINYELLRLQILKSKSN